MISFYEHSAAMCTGVNRETTIFLPLQKPHLVADNEFTFFNKPSVVYVQINVKINPLFYAANMYSCKS